MYGYFLNSGSSSSYEFCIFHRCVKSGKRKEQKDLLRKIQSANEKISNLENALSQAQDDAKSQSSKVSYLYFHI